ncbi:MAG: hypothetical protein ACK55Z_01385, partial [bacterium]
DLMILNNSTLYKTIYHMQIKSQEINSKTSSKTHHLIYFKISSLEEIKQEKKLKSKRKLKINKLIKKI